MTKPSSNANPPATTPTLSTPRSKPKPKPKVTSKSTVLTRSKKPLSTGRKPPWKRKRDIIYLIFFLIHIPVMLALDLVPLYPASLVPQKLLSLRMFYIDTYHDRFFVAPPRWFIAYAWMEAVYHLPLSLWVVGGLWRDDPLVPLHLLIYAVQTALTTLTCIVDIVDWKKVPTAHKIELGKLYGPYLALSLFMGLDMFTRLKRKITER